MCQQKFFAIISFACITYKVKYFRQPYNPLGIHRKVFLEVKSYLYVDIFVTCCSADAIEQAWQILDQIPGRATGAYSHSQVMIPYRIL